MIPTRKWFSLRTRPYGRCTLWLGPQVPTGYGTVRWRKKAS